MSSSVQDRLAQAGGHAQRGEVLQAEALLVAILRDVPGCAPAARGIATLSADREDWARAIAHLQLARSADNSRDDDVHRLCEFLMRADKPHEATSLLCGQLRHKPNDGVAWLLLGDLRQMSGDALGAARARFQGVTQMQRRGLWLDESSTPPHLLGFVRESIEAMRQVRRDHLFNAFDAARTAYGATEMRRVEYATQAYLGEVDATPADPRQQPTFFYFPGLPDAPYHEPSLHPWAGTLQRVWPEIRDEAVRLLAEDAPLEDFLGLKPGQASEAYVSGDGPAPAWDAFFFYRHGQRYDANHARCPVTSAALDAIELCRVEGQAPEICFSVLRPGSTIMAHHGVTNTRLVMHLPLIIPPDCALNVIGAGEHRWVAGELMMFDDTYKHEAWNKSDRTRVIVLMDCWNPHLTPPERVAVKSLIEAIDRFEQAPSLA